MIWYMTAAALMAALLCLTLTATRLPTTLVAALDVAMGYSPWTIAAVTKRLRERYPRRKYHRTPEERARWAGLVISGEASVAEAARQAGVTEVTIRNWVRGERGMK